MGITNIGGVAVGQEELMNKIAELEREIAFLPEGSITKKKIKDKRITRLECRKIMNIQMFGTKSAMIQRKPSVTSRNEASSSNLLI